MLIEVTSQACVENGGRTLGTCTSKFVTTLQMQTKIHYRYLMELTFKTLWNSFALAEVNISKTHTHTATYVAMLNHLSRRQEERS